MITCPSCNHQNPEGSLQCENCYTPLPATTSCPNCGASVQTDATFCGQCGFNLQAESSTPPLEETSIGSLPDMPVEELSLPEETAFSQTSADILPETAVSSPLTSPWDIDETEDETEVSKGVEPFPEQLPDIDQRSQAPASYRDPARQDGGVLKDTETDRESFRASHIPTGDRVISDSTETIDLSTTSETEFADPADLTIAEEVALQESRGFSTKLGIFRTTNSCRKITFGIRSVRAKR